MSKFWLKTRIPDGSSLCFRVFAQGDDNNETCEGFAVQLRRLDSNGVWREVEMDSHPCEERFCIDLAQNEEVYDLNVCVLFASDDLKVCIEAAVFRPGGEVRGRPADLDCLSGDDGNVRCWSMLLIMEGA